MEAGTDKAKLGIFMAVTFIVGAIVLFTLVGVNLQQEQTTYYIRYQQSVNGLQAGSTVTLSGVPVGQVAELKVNPDNVEEIIVEVSVDPKAPVKKDTKAYLLSQGITGLKYIDLKESTQGSEPLPAGQEITAGKGLIDRLSDRADELSATADDITHNIAYITRKENRERIDSILKHADELIRNVNTLSKELVQASRTVRGLIDRNETEIDTAITNVGSASSEIKGVLRQTRLTLESGRRVIDESEIAELIKGATQTNNAILAKIEAVDAETLTEAIVTLQQLLTELARTISQSQEQFRAIMFNARQASENVKALSRELRDEPSTLIFDKNQRERQLPRK